MFSQCPSCLLASYRPRSNKLYGGLFYDLVCKGRLATQQTGMQSHNKKQTQQNGEHAGNRENFMISVCAQIRNRAQKGISHSH